MINTSTEERGRQLLSIARGALTEKLLGEKAPIPNAAWLQKPGAAFVTLRTRNRLRGCIGTVIPYRSLLDDVRQNAVAAATRDGRFSPLQRRELESTSIEVSELSALERIQCTTEAELLHKLQPETDGLVMESDSGRGTFLPSVWESIPDPSDFLRQLKIKAGMAPQCWPSDLKVWRYSARKWTEDRI